MGKTYQNKIETTAGFMFNSNKPLDDRLVVDTESDLYSPDSDRIYDGMIVSVLNPKGTYRYDESSRKWIKLANTKKNSSNETVLDEALDNDSVKTENIKNGNVTKDKLSSDLQNSLLFGTFGTQPMSEGDNLQAGRIYIQFDE